MPRIDVLQQRPQDVANDQYSQRVLDALEGRLLTLDELCGELGIPVRGFLEVVDPQYTQLLSVLNSLRSSINDSMGDVIRDPLVRIAQPRSAHAGSDWKYYLANEEYILADQGKLGDPYYPEKITELAAEAGVIEGRKPRRTGSQLRS